VPSTYCSERRTPAPYFPELPGRRPNLAVYTQKAPAKLDGRFLSYGEFVLRG
jgi:hypothetical protein